MQSFGSIAVYVGSVLGVTIGMYIYTIEGWLSPLAPVFYLASFVLAAFSVLAFFWFRSAKENAERGVGEKGMSAEELSFKRLTELTGQFVLGCLALVVMLTWSVPHVRAVWVMYISNNPVQLGYALDDPSPRVLEKVCDALFETGVGPWRERLAERLAETPGVAVKCTTRAVENNRGSATVIAKMVSDIWSRELRQSSEYESFDACSKTDALKAMGALRKISVEFPLLQCAFSASSVSSRECCADASTSVSALSAPADPKSLDRVDVLRILPDVIRVAYAPNDDDVEVSEALQLSQAQEQKNAFEIACLFLEDGTENDVPTFLSESIAGGTCLPSDTDTEIVLGAPSWGSICDDVAYGRPATKKEICVALNEINVDLAVTTAKEWSAAAASEYLRSEFALDMQDGVSKGAAMGGGKSDKDEAWESLLDQSAADVLGTGDHYDATCQVLEMDPTDPNPFKNARVVESVNCERLDPNQTYREFLAERKKRRREDKRLMNDPFSEKTNGLLRKRAKEEGTNLSSSEVSNFHKEAKNSLRTLKVK